MAIANKKTRSKTSANTIVNGHADALEYELRVQKIELEMQNEELRHAQLDLANARDRFVDLYDFAPVGYFTLGQDGRIGEVNLTGAALLGVERKSLLNRPFSKFVATADADRWRRHLSHALPADDSQRIELTVRPQGAPLLHAQLDCRRVVPASGPPTLRLTLTDVTQRKLSEMDRRIAATVVEAREAERRRVARELHEDLGQQLSALKMDLASLPLVAQSQAPRISNMLLTLDDAVATVRRISAELRPMMLDDLGLNAAIDWLVRDAAARLGMVIKLRLDESDPPLGERASIALYRLVQETLGHMAQYAHATNVGIELQQRAGEVVLTVQSNGCDWPAPASGRDGDDAAMRLREQAHQLGGRLDLGKPLRGGQQFTLHLPLTDTAGRGQQDQRGLS